MENDLAKPVKAELELEGAELLRGKDTTELGLGRPATYFSLRVNPERVLRSGTGERLIMPPGFDMDFGAQDLFEVTPEVWRRTYQVHCHLVDPDTKRLLLLDRSSFVIQ